MVKTIPKRKLSPIKIILIVLAIIVGLPILFILGSIAIYTFILTPIDKAKFETLDKDSKALFSTVKQISNGAEPWVYDASCEAERAGPWATGSYFCSTKLSFEISVTDALTVASLHEKYFPTVDAAQWLKAETELIKLPLGMFGVSFVVSGAEKAYISQSNITCTYLAKLSQPVDEFNNLNPIYGSPINAGDARFGIQLDCSGKTMGNWYSR